MRLTGMQWAMSISLILECKWCDRSDALRIRSAGLSHFAGWVTSRELLLRTLVLT